MEAEDRFNARRERILHDIAQAAREKSDNGMTVALAELDALEAEEAKFMAVVKSVPKPDSTGRVDPEKQREFQVRLVVELRALAEKMAKLERIVGAEVFKHFDRLDAEARERALDAEADVLAEAYSSAGKEPPTMLAKTPADDF